MKVYGVLGAAVAAMMLLIGMDGCTSTTAATTKGRCTPGNYVFCRCADRADGSKLCKADGDSFEKCTTGGGECVGGEIFSPDPHDGEEVDAPPPSPPPADAGPSGPPNEACPGQPLALSPQDDLVVDGDTTPAVDDMKGKPGACAVGDQGPDHVYHLTPTGSGSLSVKVQGAGALNPTVYLRTSCEDIESQVACAETTGVAGLEQFNFNVVTGRDYYLVVDGASGSAGKYKLTMKLTTGSFCGDGQVDTNEACDDGNKIENDGCSNSCQQVNGDPTTGNSCPGHAVHIWPGRSVTGTGSTTPYGNTWKRIGSSCTVLASDLNIAQDHVYAVTAHGAGNLKVTLTPEATFNSMLVGRTNCTDGASTTPLMCDNQTTGAEVINLPVTNGQTVYVAADGPQNQKGSYAIKFELP